MYSKNLQRLLLPQACLILSKRNQTRITRSDVDAVVRNLANNNQNFLNPVTENAVANVRNTENQLLNLSLRDGSKVESVVGDLHPVHSTVRSNSGSYLKNRIPYSQKFLEVLLKETYLDSAIKFPSFSNIGRLSRHVPVKSTTVFNRGNFWRNCGKFLAFADALNFTDLHYENLCFRDDKVIPIDIETLFGFRSSKSIHFPELSERSVLQTGLVGKPKETDVPLVSGLMTVETSGIEKNFPYLLEEDGILNLHFERTTQKCPTELGNYLASNIFANDVLCLTEGLQSGYELIKENRKALSTKVKSLPRNTRSRLVLRDTVFYKGLICKIGACDTANHPTPELRQILQNAKGWLGTYSQEILDYETNCILNGLVPIFWVETHSGKILDAWGKTLGKFSQSPMDQILIFLNKDLSENYIQRQRSIVRKQFSYMVSREQQF